MSLPLYCPDCVGSLFGPCSMSTPCHSLCIAQIVWVVYSVHAARPLHVTPFVLPRLCGWPIQSMQHVHSMSLPLYCPDCVGGLFSPCSMSTPCHSLRNAQIVWVVYSVHAACPLHVTPFVLPRLCGWPIQSMQHVHSMSILP